MTTQLSEGVVEKSKASWEGDKVVITARRVVSSQFADLSPIDYETASTASVIKGPLNA